MCFLEAGILRLENAFLRKGNSGSVAVEVPESKMFILGSSTHLLFASLSLVKWVNCVNFL